MNVKVLLAISGLVFICHTSAYFKYKSAKCDASLKTSKNVFCFIKSYTRSKPMVNFGFTLLRKVPHGMVSFDYTTSKKLADFSVAFIHSSAEKEYRFIFYSAEHHRHSDLSGSVWWRVK